MGVRARVGGPCGERRARKEGMPTTGVFPVDRARTGSAGEPPAAPVRRDRCSPRCARISTHTYGFVYFPVLPGHVENEVAVFIPHHGPRGLGTPVTKNKRSGCLFVSERHTHLCRIYYFRAHVHAMYDRCAAIWWHDIIRAIPDRSLPPCSAVVAGNRQARARRWTNLRLHPLESCRERAPVRLCSACLA